jgi:hypothetical protein
MTVSISLGIADPVRLHIADLTVIDYRDGHAVGVGVGHDFADFRVNRGSAR